MDIPWAAVIPAIVLYYAWVIFILVDILRHEVRYLPKWGWLLIAFISVPVGGIVYLIIGRDRGGARTPASDDAPAPDLEDAGLLAEVVTAPDAGGGPAVATTGLTKVYGDTTALDDVALEVPAGSIFGLVGPNGAGKTTLLGILAGLRRPTEGSIDVGASSAGAIRGNMAVLPDTPQFDPWLTGREVVQLAQHLTGDEPDPVKVEAALAGVGLADAATRRVSGYSRGMLQRLGLASTLIGNPELVLLDEPASALDPLGRRDVLDLVGRLRGRATVVFSSHILGDVQEVSDSIAVLHEGRLRYQGNLDELLVGTAGPRYQIRLRPPVESVVTALENASFVANVGSQSAGVLTIMVTSLDEAERELPRVLAAAGARVISMRPEAPSLEDVVLELVT